MAAARAFALGRDGAGCGLPFTTVSPVGPPGLLWEASPATFGSSFANCPFDVFRGALEAQAKAAHGPPEGPQGCVTPDFGWLTYQEAGDRLGLGFARGDRDRRGKHVPLHHLRARWRRQRALT
jgi:hypothetical protein